MPSNIKASRKFNWFSSIDPKNQEVLEKLHSDMNSFYTKNDQREQYDKMILTTDFGLDPGPVTSAFLKWLEKFDGDNILEVGCGQGRIRHHLDGINKKFNYTGIELSKEVINENSIKWPNDKWISSGVYNISFGDCTFDLCFSFYVIEHLVYPEKAIIEMMRVIKNDGFLVLVFPDFTSENRLPSQLLGLSEIRNAKEKLKKGKVLDFIISLYDSRVRLRKQLKKIKNNPGSFMINSTPICLYTNNTNHWPDFDAVYIASKEEIKNWAEKAGHEAHFPMGTSTPFDEHTFIVIQKKA